MNKVEIFLPLPGMTAAMDEYFTQLHVTYLNGLPTGPELPSAELTQEELLELGFDAAQARATELTLSKLEDYTVSPDSPFITEMTNEAGDSIGWEFEFQVYTDY